MAAMRRFRITFEGQVIGSTDLAFVDDGMGLAFGRFHPEPRYEAIRPSVVRSAEARHNRHPEIAPPRLEVETDAGEMVKAFALVIDDFDEVEVDPEVTVIFDDREQFLRLVGG